MKLKNFTNKNVGFTVMEILLALFIIGILLLVLTPIVTTQLAKSNDYSYYLAYKSLEKMAGHIVALGDPEEDTAYLYNSDKTIAKNNNFDIKKYLSKYNSKHLKKYFAKMGNKFAYSEIYIFKKLFPKAMAEIVTEEIGGWDASDYDELWLTARVCSGYRVKKYSEEKTKTLSDGSTQKYTEYTYYDTNDVTCPDSPAETIDFLSTGVDCSYSEAEITTLYNNLASQSRPDAYSYCLGSYKSKCGQTTSTYNYSVTFEPSNDGNNVYDEGNSSIVDGATYYEDEISSATQGYCKLTGTRSFTPVTGSSSVTQTATPSFSSSWCTEHNFVNMTNQAATSSIDCVCKAGTEQTENNEKVCFDPCSNNKESLYAVDDGSGNFSRLCCSTDFNSATGTCCPANSFYNEATQSCECQSNYEQKSDGTCKLQYCSPGSQISSDGYCVTNPPIIKVKRFCELIASNWNINSSYCTFSSYLGGYANTDVLNAIKGTDDVLMSIKSKTGAFNSIKPNIVLDNGLKLWILSDKSASMYGLSYYSDTPHLNMCSRIELNDHSKTACENAGGYYCSTQAICFKMNDADNDILRDARTCCSSYDMSDVEKAAKTDGLNWKRDSQAYAITGFTVFVDINGSKGDGTLWDDVFPFYIATNGTVYPAYPLNAPKGLTNENGDKVITALYTAGNSETTLPTDVYYNESSGDTLKRIVAFPNVSYARALCSARNISQYTPYCLNLGSKYVNNTNATKIKGVEYLTDDNPDTSTNPCDTHTCYVSLKKSKTLW
jgi:Tfp pilus assembly protein PilV